MKSNRCSVSPITDRIIGATLSTYVAIHMEIFVRIVIFISAQSQFYIGTHMCIHTCT